MKICSYVFVEAYIYIYTYLTDTRGGWGGGGPRYRGVVRVRTAVTVPILPCSIAPPRRTKTVKNRLKTDSWGGSFSATVIYWANPTDI